VALIDLGAFAIFDVRGPGALELLEHLAMARVDVSVGRVVYTPLLTPRGTFRSDLTIVRRGAEDFRVITGGAEGARDLFWLRSHLPADGSVQLTDVSSAVSTLGQVPGPRAPQSERGDGGGDVRELDRAVGRRVRLRHRAGRADRSDPRLPAADLLRGRARLRDPRARRARPAAGGRALRPARRSRPGARPQSRVRAAGPARGGRRADGGAA